MKTPLVSLISLAIAVTASAQFSNPTPQPKPSPMVLEAVSSDHPYSLLEYRYPDGTVKLEAVNQGKCYQVYYLTYSDFINADRSSTMAKMFLPRNNKAEQGARPGESCGVGGLLPEDPSRPVEYKYQITMRPSCRQAEAFDVHLDEAGKQAHPKPPESEWAKLRTMQQAMNAGDAKPFEWVMDPVQHRPAQILGAGEESDADARVYGDKTSEEFGAALNELIQGGMNPAQAALKLQEQALRDFRAGIDKNTKIVYRSSDGTLQERPATPAEVEALRKKYSRYMQ